jgi:hypothetical protein
VDARMRVVGIYRVSDCWRVKSRVGGQSEHCACYFIFSQLHSLFLVQCIGCTCPLMLPQILKAQSFHLFQKQTSSSVFVAASPGSCSPLGL